MDTSHHKPVKRNPWYRHLPDPMVLIFGILVLAYVMTQVVPTGEFERVVVDGQTKVVPNSFHHTEPETQLNWFDIFVAIPEGMVKAAPYLFIVFIAGGLFRLLHQTGALNTAIGMMVHRVGLARRRLLITLAVFVYGFFGIAVGFENNIALVPIAVMMARMLGTSNMVGVAMSVGGIGIGFALSPINPYTVGVAQGIAELPTFSGAGMRIALVVTALSILSFYICFFMLKHEKPSDDLPVEDLSGYHLSFRQMLVLLVFIGGLAGMLVGVFTKGWYINEIAGTFLLIAIIIGVVYGMHGDDIANEMIKGAAHVTPGALIIGLATSVQVILNQGGIIDTIVHSLSALINGIHPAGSAVMASIVQGVINFFIPSGSGQAMVTMPILIPVADLVGMSRQLMISAFQIGDGLTNLIIPTSGGTLAMLALARVSYPAWLKAILPVMIIIYMTSWLALIIGHYTGY